VKLTTLNEIISLKRACNCEVRVTGGTEQGHSESGTCKHSNGFKIDIGLNTQLDNYITSRFRSSGIRSNDRAQLYTAPSGAVYAKESNHWDIAVCATASAGTPITGGSIVGSGKGTSGIGVCAPITNPSSPVSVENLQKTCLSANANLFSQIANEETRGQSIPSTVDKCSDGNPVSFGYFQINISATTALKINGISCNTAFSKPYTAQDKTCVVTNRVLYEQCRDAILNPITNIQTACNMSNNGTNLTPWNGSCFERFVSN
jgi:hypothetical protein